MQFIDLATQQRRVRGSIERRIRTVLDHGQYVMGPEIEELETTLAAYVGAKHAIGCASGTDALLLGLLAHGVGPGDVVFTTPFSFMATAEVIALLRATPVFVDIDPATFNIDPHQLELAIRAWEAGDPRSYPLPRNIDQVGLCLRGVITVDLFGLPADQDAIADVAQSRGLFVIEDAAQSFGGEYKGRRTCGIAEVGCTSFFPAKPLGAYGDGGMCFTSNGALAEKIRSIRIHGQGRDKYENIRIGINGRLDTLQAGILLAKFEIFSEEVKLRQQVAKYYTHLLGGESSPVICPRVPESSVSAWAQYSLLAREEGLRPGVLKRLQEAAIPTAIYYPRPLHLQEAFSYLGYVAGDFPVSEDCARRVFSLPMHPYVSREEQEKVADTILSFPREI